MFDLESSRVFDGGELQNKSQRSEQRLVISDTVGNWLNTNPSMENIKSNEKDVQLLYEIHTNPNLGVTMRVKESLIVTDSRIVVFWDKEVKKISSYDPEGRTYTPIFRNITLIYCVVPGVYFIQGIQSKIQVGVITVSTKNKPNIKKRKDEYLSPRGSYCSKYLGYTFNFGWRSEGGNFYARER